MGGLALDGLAYMSRDTWGLIYEAGVFGHAVEYTGLVGEQLLGRGELGDVTLVQHHDPGGAERRHSL